MTDFARSATDASTDAELAAHGDELAFARIVADHHADMARVAYAITGERSLAEDAVQSAWVIAWRKIGSLRDPERVRGWLTSIAVNEARQIMRRSRRHPVREIDLQQPGPARSDPAAGIARVDLERVLGRLSADDRALIALRYLFGYDAAAIGAITGRSAAVTRMRLSRVTARLRLELNR